MELGAQKALEDLRSIQLDGSALSGTRQSHSISIATKRTANDGTSVHITKRLRRTLNRPRELF
jgi:hypothetical protein